MPTSIGQISISFLRADILFRPFNLLLEVLTLKTRNY